MATQNPFYIKPANPLQALMGFNEAYDTSQKRARQAELDAGFQEAGRAISQGGLTDSALGRLFAMGDRAAPLITAAAALKKGSGSDDITEYEYAKRQGFAGSFAEWVQRKRAGAGEYGLNPVWGTGSDGKPALVQLGKGGEAISPKLPPNFQPSRGIEKVDMADSWAFVDKQSGQTLRVVPKNIEEKERREEVGKGIGQAQVALPGAEAKATTALETITKLETHPGKKWSVGFAGVVPGIAGTSQRDFIALLDQAKGQTFLQAFESLKGGGAITEVEGKKAEQAIARLDRAQTKEAFDEALKDLKGVIARGLEVSRKKATQGTAPAAAPVAAPSGIPPPPPGFNLVQP